MDKNIIAFQIEGYFSNIKRNGNEYPHNLGCSHCVILQRIGTDYAKRLKTSIENFLEEQEENI